MITFLNLFFLLLFQEGGGDKTQYIYIQNDEREKKKKEWGWMGEQFYENISLKYCF